MTYWQSTRPGAGRRNPRAHARTSARTIDLGGQWRFRLSPTPAGTGAGFTGADFDDAAWDPMPVPSHWVLEEFTPLAGGPARSMRGTSEGPLYTNTSYPIPLDPPHVPNENPTGDYRCVFDVPADFGPAVLRFQGVDSCAKVWLNGTELGWSTGSRLPFEFDAPVRPGRNVLAVRVHRWSAGTYLEDQDMWWLPGIFRDVELIERPAGAIDDHHVHADYDPATGQGTLRVDATAPATVEIPELGVSVPAGETVTVPVEPWSAEVPRLYRGTLTGTHAGGPGEQIDLAIGFRRIEIIDGVFRVNGRPVKFRGVNRHEHHPDTGRTLDLETMRADVIAMKRANIDSVRTSHYPPHPAFLDLCDEYGLWVVVEADLETHGFIFTGWEGNPPAEPAWADAVLDRMIRTVERDKNHPSVVVWSMANESWTGEAFTTMREWTRERDPSRPVLYERDPSYRDSDFYSSMYPSLDLLEQIGRGSEPAPEQATAAEDERRRALPYLLVEYAHAMGNGPGSLSDYWDIIARHDRLCGGFVWEWIDHGFNAIGADSQPYVMHGQDVDYEPNGGRYTLHGLVFADRTPSTGLIELATAYEPIGITIGSGRVTVTNHRHTASSADLTFAWELRLDGETRASGPVPVPEVPAGQSATVDVPGLDASDLPEGLVTVVVTAALAAETAWAPAGHAVAVAELILREPATPARAATPGDGREVATIGAGTVTVGGATFDTRTGQLIRLGDLDLAGPMPDVFRAPTENDRGQGDLNNVAKIWDAVGMDRMTNHLRSMQAGPDWVRATGRTAATAHPHALAWQMHWQLTPGGIDLHMTADFEGPWADTPYMHRDIWLPRLGLLAQLPGGYDSVEWVGRGPHESYADSWRSAIVGRYTASIDDLQVPYPVPQENGNHTGTRRLRLTGADLPDVTVTGLPVFDFTARRWSSQALAAATKPHQLTDSGRVWLNLDHAQQGLGSASVGPALPEQYRIPRERTTWRIRFEVG